MKSTEQKILTCIDELTACLFTCVSSCLYPSVGACEQAAGVVCQGWLVQRGGGGGGGKERRGGGAGVRCTRLKRRLRCFVRCVFVR